ncbi:Hpt domain-containing protein [Roseiarcaceae bacterium H3SJ34-1]|uniref:Hpt domain-containing protein n=1 Tax=Terripilifer ovatus TaxID=3032367 RepID=UPI003AB97E3B|nr:Hpt domain-containing protein [Roseiarcaceae bacterium H3SJ34-1]
MNTSALRRPDIENMPNESGIGTDRPIDLVHLSRQTLGDRGLEIELLQLFDRQAAQIAARLAADTGSADRRWRHDLSHTLKGSARAIGAGIVANAAQHYENVLASTRDDSQIGVARDALIAAVDVARKAIRGLLADS